MGIISNIKKIFNVEAPRKFLPKQIDVLDRCLTDEAILYSGAFRAGKTLLLAHAAIRACLENPGTKGLIGSQTHTTLKSVVMDLVEEELDLYQKALRNANIDLNLVTKAIHSDGKMEILFFNGSRLLFRACDMERKLSGYTLDFFGIDEPVDVAEQIFTQLIGRISGTGNLKNKFGLLTTNPGSDLHWLFKYFYIKKLDRYIHIDTTTYDNVLLPDYDNYIKSKEQVWDADWIRRYLNGNWGMFEGQVYKDFNPGTMVGDFKNTPVSYHIAGIDWGLENPHCILDIGVTADRRLIVLREHYGKKMTTSELAPLIATWHKTSKFRKLYCDPSAADLIQQVYDKGLPVAHSKNGKLQGYANNDVDNGIAKVKSILRNKLILVDKSCTYLISEIQAYRYKEGTEKPIKENDHSCDALRYAVTDFNPDMDVISFKGTFTNLFKRRF